MKYITIYIRETKSDDYTEIDSTAQIIQHWKGCRRSNFSLSYNSSCREDIVYWYNRIVNLLNYSLYPLFDVKIKFGVEDIYYNKLELKNSLFYLVKKILKDHYINDKIKIEFTSKCFIEVSNLSSLPNAERISLIFFIMYTLIDYRYIELTENLNNATLDSFIKELAQSNLSNLYNAFYLYLIKTNHIYSQISNHPYINGPSTAAEYLTGKLNQRFMNFLVMIEIWKISWFIRNAKDRMARPMSILIKALVHPILKRKIVEECKVTEEFLDQRITMWLPLRGLKEN